MFRLLSAKRPAKEKGRKRFFSPCYFMRAAAAGYASLPPVSKKAKELQAPAIGPKRDKSPRFAGVQFVDCEKDGQAFTIKKRWSRNLQGWREASANAYRVLYRAHKALQTQRRRAAKRNASLFSVSIKKSGSAGYRLCQWPDRAKYNRITENPALRIGRSVIFKKFINRAEPPRMLLRI